MIVIVGVSETSGVGVWVVGGTVGTNWKVMLPVGFGQHPEPVCVPEYVPLTLGPLTVAVPVALPEQVPVNWSV